MNVHRIDAHPRHPGVHPESSRTLREGVGHRNSLRGIVCLVLLGGVAISAIGTPAPPASPRVEERALSGVAQAIVQARLDPARLPDDHESSPARADGR